VADKSNHNESQGPVRALYRWLTGAKTGPAAPPDEAGRVGAGVPVRIGRYAIARKIGEGGMGVVYAAHDDRLGRTIALKTMSAIARDEPARRRFWREARAAASVNHPNICQIYEVGEDAGELFMAMELLEGEALADRLGRGPMSVADAVPIGLGILTALSALHARGIVHRDLKPSNVFLTPHGVKLLDFGLASFDMTMEGAASAATRTQTGVVMGTPRYMAPEVVRGEPVDTRTDLFAAGAILFEMLSGRPAFAGRTAVEIVHSAMFEQPPALAGSPGVAAIDRVIRRALAKKPADRQSSADAMADELRRAGSADTDSRPVLAQALTRLVVLPFRVLRPDPESDFLAFSLPDAIATSLSGTGSMIVRSTAAAARFAGEAPDLKALAADADVDRVVLGTLMRSGDQLRATAQLVEAPSGTLVTSHTVQSSMGDLFRLQDDIASRIVEALSLPLGSRMPPPSQRDVPRDPRAYELYLRANELARSYDGLVQARDLYQQCLDLDPAFAPAWAQIGRCRRVIGKFIDPAPDSDAQAEQAFERALDLNPRLSVAHKFYAHLEAETGHPQRALVRLLGEATRHGTDPELFAGLVHACRYCGLLEESAAAHEESRRLDPNVPTSFEQTLLLTCAFDRLLALERRPGHPNADGGMRIMGLGLAGHQDEARQALAEMRQAMQIEVLRGWTDFILAWLDRRAADMTAMLSWFSRLKIQDDPEALFLEGWLLCDAGDPREGLTQIVRAVTKGYYMAPTLLASRTFDALRGEAAFTAIVAEAEAGRARARQAFDEAGGRRLLGA
jgi:non-specific serine/threonine protein kinase